MPVPELIRKNPHFRENLQTPVEEMKELKEPGSFIFMPPSDPEKADFLVIQRDVNTGKLVNVSFKASDGELYAVKTEKADSQASRHSSLFLYYCREQYKVQDCIEYFVKLRDSAKQILLSRLLSNMYEATVTVTNLNPVIYEMSLAVRMLQNHREDWDAANARRKQLENLGYKMTYNEERLKDPQGFKILKEQMRGKGLEIYATNNCTVMIPVLFAELLEKALNDVNLAKYNGEYCSKPFGPKWCLPPTDYERSVLLDIIEQIKKLPRLAPIERLKVEELAQSPQGAAPRCGFF